MKTLNAIKESIEEIRKNLDKAKLISQSLRERSEKAKRLISEIKIAIIPILLLFIMTSLSAQSFENINGLGKTSTEVTKITQEFMFYNCGQHDGNLFSAYYSGDYGTIEYLFDKQNICVKMIIYSAPHRSLKIEGFKVRERKEKDRTVTIITQ